MELIKVYLADGMKAKLQERAGRESLSSFVAGLIGSYFAEYPGLSTSEEKRMEASMPKVGDTVTIKKPARFVPISNFVTVLQLRQLPRGARPDSICAAGHEIRLRQVSSQR